MPFAFWGAVFQEVVQKIGADRLRGTSRSQTAQRESRTSSGRRVPPSGCNVMQPLHVPNLRCIFQMWNKNVKRERGSLVVRQTLAATCTSTRCKNRLRTSTWPFAACLFLPVLWDVLWIDTHLGLKLSSYSFTVTLRPYGLPCVSCYTNLCENCSIVLHLTWKRWLVSGACMPLTKIPLSWEK